jgi:Mrp family chromosome partitioning ATPase
MTPPSDAPVNGIASRFLESVRKSLPQLLLATIAAGLAAFLAQSWITPRYQAEARIVRLPGAEEAVGLRAHAKALSDPERVFATATALELQRRVEFSRPGGGLLTQLSLGGAVRPEPARTPDERLLARLYQGLEVTADEAADTISVRLTSSDPVVSAAFVNKLVESYVGGPTPTGLRVAVSAVPPKVPVSPRKGANAMLGMAATLLIGIGGILTVEAVRSARRGRRADRQSSNPLEVRARTLAGALTGFTVTSAVSEVAERLKSAAVNGRGFRTIVAGEAPEIDGTAVAVEVAKALSNEKRLVVLVRWSLMGGDIAGRRGPRQPAGLNDLLDGNASFEDVISRLPDSRVHAIAAGAAAIDEKVALDPDRLNLILDTLDEVYDHIVVIADHNEARMLFAGIEGRFDAAISVAALSDTPAAVRADVDHFLGFEVADIEIIRFLPAVAASTASARRKMAVC